ncbi:MAG: hypothetical protein AAB652_01820 [Patescibacteria group bacterium]
MQKPNKTFIYVFLAVTAGVLLLGYKNFFPSGSGPDGTGNVPCINPTLPIPENLHIHPHIKIMIDGKDIAVSPTIGLGVIGCERALHTHDSSGEIHIEPNFPQDFTLGDFFTLWGKPFSSIQLLDKSADDAHEVVMTVNGKQSTEFEKLILNDKQEIIVEYRTKTSDSKTSMLTEEQALKILQDYLKKTNRTYATIKLVKDLWPTLKNPDDYYRFDLSPSTNIQDGSSDGAIVNKATGEVKIFITSLE